MADVMVVTEDNFDSEIAQADKPALIDFWAPWCGPCRMMHPILESLAEKMEGKAIIARCNVDEAPGLAGQFSITAIPTMIIFNDGGAADVLVGVTPEDELTKRLEALI